MAAPLDPAPACGWFVYHRAPGKHRGRYDGPLDGPDAAIALLRHLVEIELPTSATYATWEPPNPNSLPSGSRYAALRTPFA